MKLQISEDMEWIRFLLYSFIRKKKILDNENNLIYQINELMIYHVILQEYMRYLSTFNSTPFRSIPAMTFRKDETYKDLRYRIITHDLKPMEP